MVMVRNLVKVGNREVKKRYIGNKLIFEDLGDKTEIISGEEIFTDKADDSVVHVEVDGKSYQEDEPSPDNPSEIHSLNDFDVVSSLTKRNYILNSELSITTQTAKYLDLSKDLTISLIKKYGFTGSIDIEIVNHKMLEYYKFNRLGFELEIKTNSGSVAYYQTDIYPKGEDFKGRISNYFKPREEWSEIVSCTFWIQTGGDKVYVGNPKITIGDNTQDVWTPAPEDITEDSNHPFIDKINLLLDEHLRSVGGIKDRLFIDSDGLWKVERNVEPIHPEDGSRTIEETYGVLDKPIYEVFPQDYQDKLNNLRSFQGSDYVYTVLNETDILPTVAENLKPTLHATFKSKGWYDYYKKTLLK